MKTLTLDRKKNRSPFAVRQYKSRAERVYVKNLKHVANHVGKMISAFPAGDISTLPTIEEMLRRYAEALTPWAVRAAQQMIDDVNARDKEMWISVGKEISAELAKELATAPTGEAMKKLLAEQVTLIKSIPIDAAKRVHELTIKGLEDSTRVNQIVIEIMRSGEVAESRATLIARTEVARTASTLNEARATHVGSTTYIWRTSGDGAVRSDHKALNGKAFRWDAPPIADQRSGARANPGCIYNCRCYAEPVIPE